MTLIIDKDAIFTKHLDVDFDPFAGPRIVKVIAATEPQLEVWLSCVIGGDDASRAYNESVSLELEGDLNKDALDYALEEVCRRHELLRSTISPDGRHIIVYESMPISLRTSDISGQDALDQEEHHKKLNYLDARTPFNLEKGPLFRSYLVKVADTKHILKLSAHHIVCDGWSFGILLENISALYSSFVAREPAALDEPVSFGDYAIESAKYLKSRDYEATEKYWVDQYRTNVPVLDLPTDFSRPLQRTFEGSRLDFNIAPELIKSIQTLGAKSGSSLTSILISSFEVYLHLLTGQSDIVLGVPAAGQAASGKHEVIGHCVNMLPIRSMVQPDIPFCEYLIGRKSNILDCFDHQKFTFGSLLKKLNIARDSSRIPLIPVVFNIDIGMEENVSFTGLHHSLFSDPRAFENFEIFLNLTGTSNSFVFEWSYNTQLFSAATIKRMMRDFEQLLIQIASNPHIRIKDINVESHLKQVNTWNDFTIVGYPRDKTVTRLIDDIALEYPAKTAIYYRDKRLSYAELRRKSNQLANYLSLAGVEKGDIVGISVDRSFEMVISLLAVMKAGGAYLPLDPHYPIARLKFMIDDSKASYLILSGRHKSLQNDSPKTLILENIWNDLESFSESSLPVKMSGDDLAYILYTSGSTGKAKGVQIEHHSLTNFLLSVQKEPGLRFKDTILAHTTISFDIAGTELFLPLITGASMHLVASETAQDGRDLLRILESGAVSIMQATPTTWRMLLEAGWDSKLDIKIICTGEAFPKDLAETLLLRGTEVWNGYGPTETTIWSSVKQITNTTNKITIGRPIANTKIYVLDERLKQQPVGKVGEIYIAGEGVARGYLNREELSSEKFIIGPDTFGLASKMYATGDLGYFQEDGELLCLGRIDSQVKVRGHRLEVGEIEYHLTQQPGVKSAIVVVNDIKNNQYIVAYIVPEGIDRLKSCDVCTVDLPELEIRSWRTALGTVLPSYMIPHFFVAINQIPITENFKVDRKRLPLPVRERRMDDAVMPRQEYEKVIHDIWAEALSLEAIDITSNFFELGGHSLVAVRTLLDLEKQTGIKLPMSAMFEASTIEQLAQRISSVPKDLTYTQLALEQPILSKTEVNAVRTIPPQWEIWAGCILGGEDANKSYNISLNERLIGDLDESALRRSLQEVLNRHESLRASFSHDGSEMLIRSPSDINYAFVDFSDLSPAIREERLKFELKEIASVAFDLYNGPLIKAYLLRLNKSEHILSIVVHHIVCDGFSSDVLMSELSQLYSAFAQSNKPTLPTAAKYSDFALRKTKFYESKDYQRVEQFWVDQFKASPPILNIPTDFVRPTRRTYKGSRVFYHIDSNLADSFKAIGFAANCSPSISLRAAFEVFLSFLCKQRDIVVGLPFASQLAERNINLVGHCVNLLPVFAEVNSTLTFSEYLKKRKQELLNIYDFADITFSSLLNKVDICRDKSRAPLVPIFLNVHSESAGYKFSNLTAERINIEKEFESFEIAINIDDLGSGMTVRWDYNTDLFKEKTIQKYHVLFGELLELIERYPDTNLGTLASMLDPQSDKKALQEVSALSATMTAKDDKNLPIPQLIGEQSRIHPDKIAISFGEANISYEQVEKRSNQFANHLIKEGVSKGDVVGILMNRSIEMVIALIAVMKSGATYLPLDPLYPRERLRYMLNDSEAKFLVTSQEDGLFDVKSLVFSLTLQLSDECPKIPFSGSDLAYILYTSGSTGNPKGVQVENHSLLNFLTSMQQHPGISRDDVLLAVTTISFDISGLELFLPLISGAQLVLASSSDARDGTALLRLIKEKQVSILQATPITWTMLLECGWNRSHPLKVLCGGEAFPKQLAESLVEMGNEVWNMYGPTETTIWSSVKRVSDIDSPISIGYPIANTQIYILTELLSQCPLGTPGEIYISGEGVARGYINRSELTSEKFLSDPFRTNERMYKTGDIGYFLESGEIVCLGRTDDQIKVHGFRIELGEIEYVLSKQPNVKEAVVTVLHDDHPNKQSLIAYVVLKQRVTDTFNDSGFEDSKANVAPQHVASEWKKALRESLPDYMVPGKFFIVNHFPTTKNGKIDRKAFSSIETDTSAINVSVFDSLQPRNRMEKIVAQAWRTQLNVQNLSVNDNFFDLGGNSLMAIRLMLQIEKETGIRLPISTLFDSPTIEELCKMLRGEKSRKKWQSLVPIKTDGGKTPLYLVHGGGYNVLTFEPISKHMDPDQPIYALQGLGLFDKSKLFSNIEEIASFYISEILDNDPIGPYNLAGYSSGGILAFEMARQLIQKGKQVVSLVMLDTSYEERHSYEGLLANTKNLIGRQIRKALFYTKSLIKHPKETAKYLKRRMESGAYAAPNDFIQEDEINEAYANAFKKYKMKPLPIKVDLFRVKTRVYYINEPVHYGWTRYAGKGVKIHKVSGEHNTFLLHPYAKQFASRFQKVIDSNG